MRNLGVIIEKRPTDFVGGTLPYEVLNPSGDWTAYLPAPENQFTHHTDSQACVTFSILNTIETQYKFFTGREINFSDRFIAKLSGTTPQGNSVQNVMKAIKTYGLVLESDWPTDFEFNWDEYYAEIPQSVKDKAIKVDCAYEFFSPVESDLLREMKHAPLEIIIEAQNPYHSVMRVNKIQQFDHYVPNLRPMRSISIATKILLKGVSMGEFVHISGTQTYGVQYTTEFVTTIVKFTSDTDAKEKLKNIPGALKSDGSPDFPRAKEIKI